MLVNRVTVENNPSSEDVQWLVNEIRQFNFDQAQVWFKPVTLFARNPVNKIVGGIRGGIVLDGLFIDILYVDKAARGNGWGKKLMEAAEAEALANNCSFVHLDTFSFQALPFYQKLGYELFGELNYSNNIKRYFLKKNVR